MANEITKSEMDLFILKNPEYYDMKFKQMDRTVNKRTWNWSAFLIPVSWLLYRKMYVQALIMFIVRGVLAFIPFINIILNCAIYIGFGMYANSMYREHINKQFIEIELSGVENREMMIRKKGGTSIVLPIAIVVGAAIIGAVVSITSIIGLLKYYYII